jgi:predicted RNA binding protein YcfA (HicA-like mRNA interferase family)
MNSIDYSRLHSLTARKLVNALVKDGFYLDRKSGSHHQFIHPVKGRVTISFHHSRDTFPIGTLKGIIQDAGWTEDDLKNLGLQK